MNVIYFWVDEFVTVNNPLNGAKLQALTLHKTKICSAQIGISQNGFLRLQPLFNLMDFNVS
jgi:hypothetical protein